jgi:hypothetical protein
MFLEVSIHVHLIPLLWACDGPSWWEGMAEQNFMPANKRERKKEEDTEEGLGGLICGLTFGHGVLSKY